MKRITAALEDLCLRLILEKHGIAVCKVCDTKADRGSCSWNNKSTEAGTPYSTIHVECQFCFEELAHCQTWAPVESFAEFLIELESELANDD